MGTPAENKAVVQEGLDKRKRKRKDAAFDAEQEAITAQMIDIVNKNANSARIKAQAERVRRKKCQTIKAKIAYIRKRNGNISTNLLVYTMLASLATTLYVTNLMELWSALIIYVSWAAYMGLGIYQLSKNTTEITRLKERNVTNVR